MRIIIPFYSVVYLITVALYASDLKIIDQKKMDALQRTESKALLALIQTDNLEEALHKIEDMRERSITLKRAQGEACVYALAHKQKDREKAVMIGVMIACGLYSYGSLWWQTMNYSKELSAVTRKELTLFAVGTEAIVLGFHGWSCASSYMKNRYLLEPVEREVLAIMQKGNEE
ncbi:MAG: hypothetical protein WCE21_00070 [Candidatus Babeliales bacterium]